MSTPAAVIPVGSKCSGVPTSSRIFLFFAFVISIFIIGVTIANLVYYNKIRSGGNCVVTQGEAEAMFWVNVIILVFALILFIWSLIGMFLRPSHVAYLTAAPGS